MSLGRSSGEHTRLARVCGGVAERFRRVPAIRIILALRQNTRPGAVANLVERAVIVLVAWITLDASKRPDVIGIDDAAERRRIGTWSYRSAGRVGAPVVPVFSA